MFLIKKKYLYRQLSSFSQYLKKYEKKKYKI